MEGLAIGGIVLALGVVVFLAACLGVIIAAGIREAATGVYRLLVALRRRSKAIWGASQFADGTFKQGFHGETVPPSPVHETAAD